MPPSPVHPKSPLTPRPKPPQSVASSSSSSSPIRMQERLRRVLTRSSDGRPDEVSTSLPRHRSSAQTPQVAPSPPVRNGLFRAHTTPAMPQHLSPWPLAKQDEEHLNQFKLQMAGYYRGASSYVQAIEMIGRYQNYLRTRVVQVSEDLREFKDRHEAVLATLIDDKDLKMWQMLNGTEVLIQGLAQNPFQNESVISFLEEQVSREEQLDHIIQEKIQDIRRTHGESLSSVRCRELLVMRAHLELVEKDYIQFYLELTMLSRCQLTAIRERRSLSAHAAGRPSSATSTGQPPH